MDDVVERVLKAVNAHDLEGFLSCYAADALIEDGGGTVLAHGHEQLRARYGPMLATYPLLRVEASSPRWTAGPYVLQQEAVGGRSPKTEKHIAIYRVEEGLIKHERLLR